MRAAATTVHQGQPCHHPKGLWESGPAAAGCWEAHPRVTLTSLAEAPHQICCNPAKRKEHCIGIGPVQSSSSTGGTGTTQQPQCHPLTLPEVQQLPHSDLCSHDLTSLTAPSDIRGLCLSEQVQGRNIRQPLSGGSQGPSTSTAV